MKLTTFILSAAMFVASPAASNAEQQPIAEIGNWKLVYDTDYQECVAFTALNDFNFGFMYSQKYETLTFRVMPIEPIMVMGNTEMQIVFRTRNIAINQVVEIELGHAILPLNNLYVKTFIDHSSRFNVNSMYTGTHMINGEQIPFIIEKLVDTEGC